VPTLPGTEDPVSDRGEALKGRGADWISADHQGGIWRRAGRGMRVVHKAGDLDALLDEAQGEAERAFWQCGGVFWKSTSRAPSTSRCRFSATGMANVLHLHERDCSVQRRHQKVVEIAPSVGLDERVAPRAVRRCGAPSRKRSVTTNAGTIEFLYDLDTKEWFFIEMNPRIQVEHTVTEQITGIDLVRSQILIAQGAELHGPELALPQQNHIPRMGYAVQCPRDDRGPGEQIHAELRQDSHLPPGGRFRHPARRPAWATRGAVITPFTNSLLVKITASGQTFDMGARPHGSRTARVSASAA